MTFTQEQKNSYLDRLALATQQGIWQTAMALMKSQEKLAKKKALLTTLEQQLENKEFENARDGKNQIKHVEDEIANLESEIQESRLLMETGRTDLELIEEYRGKPI
jgi:predicted  nucleic acid-binding Zn-ribbon protein